MFELPAFALEGIELHWPWLLLLAPLPLLMGKLPALERRQAALRVPFFTEANQLAQSASSRAKSAASRQALLWLIWLCALLAAANPQRLGEPISQPSSGRDLLLAVDISGSMREPDMVYNNYRITRLMAVKKVVGDFIARRQGDRLGLVLFGTQAFLQAPLTFDSHTVQQLLLEAEAGYAGETTAIGDAIALSIKRLREQPQTAGQSNKRVIILLTDGENTAGELSLSTAMDIAKKANTTLYTIAFSPYDREVDVRGMQQLAQETGGEFFRARNTADLEAIHHQLDQLEPNEQEADTYRPVESLFYWPLALAFFASLALALLTLASSAFVRRGNVA